MGTSELHPHFIVVCVLGPIDGGVARPLSGVDAWDVMKVGGQHRFHMRGMLI
jgi:hypothetical protein